MREISRLIVAAREMTNNQEFTADTSGQTLEGIPDNLFLEWANDGQDFLQAAIVAANNTEFATSIEMNVVSGQDSYSLPQNVFLNHSMIIWYSFNGDPRNYERLRKKDVIERVFSTSQDASHYIKLGNVAVLQPIPLSLTAKIKIEFKRELDDLDIKRGTVSSASISGSQLVSFQVATDANLDANALATAEYMCINDSHGNVLMAAIPVASWDSGSRTITVESGWTFQTGETIPAGAFVTVGQYSTTHSKLAANCERFIKLYMQKRALAKDHSMAAAEEDQEVSGALQTILDGYSDSDEDVTDIPIDDGNILL